MTYSVIKALHLIAVISWMAGMLYLPRLFVYHCGVAKGSEASEMLKVMERRLMRFIINPAMIAAWLLGAWLVYLYGLENLKHAGWFHFKVLMLVGMQLCHAAFSRWRKAFAADRNIHPARFYRMMNEVPTVLMIVIVLLVIVKPF